MQKVFQYSISRVWTLHIIVAICHWQRSSADFTSDFTFSLESRNVCGCAIFKHHLCLAKHCLNISSLNNFCEFEHSGPNKFFFTKTLIFKIQNESLCGRNLVKTNKTHNKITCRFELDTLPGTADCAVEFNSTLDR